MHSRFIRIVFFALGLVFVDGACAWAQGGWDVWTIRLRDGSPVEAAPIWSLDAKALRFGFSKLAEGSSIERPRIQSMSNNLGNSEYRASKGADFVMPALPEGEVDQDLVILDDGRQVVGAVTIQPGNDASGKPEIYRPVLVQNGVETDLTRVAHIKLAVRAVKHDTPP